MLARVVARGSLVALLLFLASCGSSAATSGPGAAPSGTGVSSSSTSTPSAHPGKLADCGPASATTLAANRYVRVYAQHDVVYGCSVAKGKSIRLGHDTRSIAEARVSPVAVGGELAAYGLARFGVDTGRTSVVVRRLSDGKQLKEFAATQAVGVESFQSVGSIVVKPDGAVAWIGTESSIVGGGRGTVEVHVADAQGDRILDQAPSKTARIQPASLRLVGSTLSWTDAGVAHHAILH
jgi:hypothetical protein